MKTSQKFKSGISIWIMIFFVIYHIMIAGLFILPYFLYKDVTSGLGVMFLIFDLLLLIPLLFNTYYSLEEKEIFIFQWPFVRKKVKYCDIFEISDELPKDRKNIKKVNLSKRIVVIGYYKYDQEGKNRVKKYLVISPKDMDLFLIKMGGKFTRARELAKKLEEDLKAKNVEHYRKKSIADKAKKEKEEANKPVDVVVAPKKKTDNVKIKDRKK